MQSRRALGSGGDAKRAATIWAAAHVAHRHHVEDARADEHRVQLLGVAVIDADAVNEDEEHARAEALLRQPGLLGHACLCHVSGGQTGHAGP